MEKNLLDISTNYFNELSNILIDPIYDYIDTILTFL